MYITQEEYTQMYDDMDEKLFNRLYFDACRVMDIHTTGIHIDLAAAAHHQIHGMKDQLQRTGGDQRQRELDQLREKRSLGHVDIVLIGGHGMNFQNGIFLKSGGRAANW